MEASTPLAEAVVRAEEQCDWLLSGPGLADVVEKLASTLSQSGVKAVYPASESGAMVIGALFLAHPGRFARWHPTSGMKVGLVEGVAISAIAISQAASLVRTAGSEPCVGFVVPAEIFVATEIDLPIVTAKPASPRAA